MAFTVLLVAVSGPAAAEAADPVIAAAGDIACSPSSSNYNGGNGTADACRMKYTSDLLVNAGLAAVLPLGDTQYDTGKLTSFMSSYDPTWGRVKSITRPALGNHEYKTAGASGYFDYFNGTGNSTGLAGDRDKGYYSFDVGTWHLVALNSSDQCTIVACGAGSAQETWLKADLAAHPNQCTLAYWHHPFFNSGHDGNLAGMQAMFQDLYNADADIVLGGHAHDYERFAPQNPSGQLDNARGIRQFVVGVGGAFFTAMGTTKANSQVRQNNIYGVLKLTLHPTSYDWQFVPEAGKTFTDSGSGNCHGTTSPPDTTKPTPPANLTANAGPGQVALAWQASTDDVGVTGYRVYRGGAEIASVSGTTLSYTDTGLGAGTYSYTVRAMDAAGNVSDPSNTASGTVSPSDTQKPTAPSGLTATATSSTRVDLSWQAASDNVAVTGYRVYRNGAQLASIGATTGYSDASVAASTTYRYEVRAFDAAGNLSDPSNPASATTPGQTVFTFSPQADTRVEESKPNGSFGNSFLRTAGAGGSRVESYLRFTVSGVPAGAARSAKLRIHSMSDGTVDGPGVFTTPIDWKESVKWSNRPARTSAVTDDKGAVAAESWIEFDVTPFVTGGGTYSFGLATTSADGADFYSREAATFRPELVVTTGAPDTTSPGAPGNLTATAAAPGRIDLSWQASSDDVGVTGYDVYRDGALIARLGAATSYSDTSVIAGLTYSYVVRAVDGAGNTSAPSNTASATATTTSPDTERPTAPGNLSATAAAPGRIDLSWQASSDNVGVTGYKLYREGALIASLGTATSYSDTSVAANSVYHYEVRAFDAAGNLSDPSNTATAATPAGATVVTIAPEADARVEQTTPTTNFGTSFLRANFSTSTSNVESYLSFTVTGVSAGTVQSAKLRVHATSNGTVDGPAVYTSGSNWSETAIDWNTRPARTSVARDDKGTIPPDTWVEYDVTPFVMGSGTYSFNLATTSSDGVNFDSRESTSFGPQLVLTLG